MVLYRSVYALEARSWELRAGSWKLEAGLYDTLARVVVYCMYVVLGLGPYGPGSRLKKRRFVASTAYRWTPFAGLLRASCYLT